MRCLRQWQALNDEPVDWNVTANDYNNRKYSILYDYDGREFDIGCNWSVRTPSEVYFSTEKKVEEAIKAFHDELIWYFTQYRSRLDEPEVRDAKID